MKKHVCKGVLGLALACLTACAPAASSAAPSAAPPESVPPPESVAQEPASPPAVSAGPLTFFDLKEGSANGRGYYEILTDVEGSVLVYTDFETAQRRILCDRTGCSHTDERCPAFVKISVSRPQLLALDDRLVLVHGRVPALGQTPAVPARVEVRGLDGTGSRTAVTFDSNEEVGLYFAADEKSLYALVDTLSDGTSVTAARLVRVELDSGAVETLAQLDWPQDTLLIQGVFENHVVMKRIFEGGTSRQIPTEDWEQKISSQIHQLFYIDDQGNERILLQWRQYQAAGFVFGDACYLFFEDGELHKADFKTGTGAVLADFGPDWGKDFVSCAGKMGDMLIIDGMPRGSLPGQAAARRFAVDTVKGDCTELPQQATWEGWQQPVPILYADDRRVLALWADGQYGLMNTSDFLAGSRDYTPLPLVQ